MKGGGIYLYRIKIYKFEIILMPWGLWGKIEILLHQGGIG